jgi:hypothetical protein
MSSNALAQNAYDMKAYFELTERSVIGCSRKQSPSKKFDECKVFETLFPRFEENVNLFNSRDIGMSNWERVKIEKQIESILLHRAMIELKKDLQ